MSEEKDTAPRRTSRKRARNRRKNRSRNRAGLITAFVLVLLTGAVALGLKTMIGRPVDAPLWLRDRIEHRIAEAMPGIDVRFGRMSLVLRDSTLARFILWDVSILNTQGDQIAALSDIEAGFSPTALLRRQLVLREAQLSGAIVTLQRGEDGVLGLALGDAFDEGATVPNVTQIIAAVDAAVMDPRLIELDLLEADALTIRYEDRRARRGWTGDGGRISVRRENGILNVEADVALLGGSDKVATVALNASSTIGADELDFGFEFKEVRSRDIATQSPALAWLTELDAPISGAMQSEMKADGRLGPLFATLQLGQGVLQPNNATRAIPFDSARTFFTYDPGLSEISFGEISVSSSLGQVRAEGAASVFFDADGWANSLVGQFRFSDISVIKGSFFDNDLNVASAETAFKLDLDPFHLSLGEVQVTDPDFPIAARGDVFARSDGWDIALDAWAAQSHVEQVLAFWPEHFKPKPRKWVAENVYAGRFSDIVFALRALPNEQPETFLDFMFHDGTVRYARGPALLERAQGRLTIYDQRLGLRLDKGVVVPEQGGEIDVSGSEFVIPRTRAKPATGIVQLKARGPVEAMLSYIDNEKWQVMTKAGRAVDIASGDASLSGRVTLPLVKGVKRPQIDIALAGELENVFSDALVPGHTLSSRKLDLKLGNAEVSLQGDALFSGVPVSGRWAQSLEGGGGLVQARAEVSQSTLQAVGITLPQDLLSGTGQGEVTLQLAKGEAPAFTFTSDLSGIELAFPWLGWRSAPSQTGQFEISGRFGAPVQIDGLSLSAGDLTAAGGLQLTPQGRFQALTLDRFTIGSWLDVVAGLRSTGDGAPLAFDVASGRFDLQKSSFPGPAARSGSATSREDGPGLGPVTVNLDRLQISDKISINSFRGDFDALSGFQGRFDGSLGKGAEIQGEVLSGGGRTAFRITGKDAGDILKAAGVIDTLSDGTFQLDIAPVRGAAGSFDGQVVIEGARLRDAPTIGALLDGISIVGLIDQLNGPGIFFSTIESRFRLSPNQVIIKEGSAVGPSMGVSVDGYFDLPSGLMDIQGVLSPIYFVNGLGQVFARKGEGLIGFNFNLRGNLDNPRVSVNPLSALTPGMFRDIFRRPPPEVSE